VALELIHDGVLVCDAAWSPDGSQLATIDVNGRARLWSTADIRRRPSHEGRLGVVEHPDEGCHQHTLPYHTKCAVPPPYFPSNAIAPTLELFHGSGGGVDVMHVSWSPDGSRLVTASFAGGLRSRGACSDGTLLFELSHERGSADGAQWGAGAPKSLLRGDVVRNYPPPLVWDILAGGMQPTVLGAGDEALVIVRAWSPDSTRLVAALHPTTRTVSLGQGAGHMHSLELAEESRAMIWDATGASQPMELRDLRGRRLHEVAWSPDGTFVLAACGDGSARVLDATRGALVCVLGDEWNYGEGASWSKGMISAHFLPCGRRIVATHRGKDWGGAFDEGEDVVVAGPSYAISEYRRIIDDSRRAGVGFSDIRAPLHSAEALLAALEAWCCPGEEVGLRALLTTLLSQAEALCVEHLGPAASTRPGPPAPIEMSHQGARAVAACLWASTAQARFRGVAREFCWLLNYAVDTDDAELLEAGRWLLLALGRWRTIKGARWHADSAGDITAGESMQLAWRGGGFDEAWRQHFVKGTRHRIPGFVAASPRREVAYRYMEIATQKCTPAVEWCFEIPSACSHLLCMESPCSRPTPPPATQRRRALRQGALERYTVTQDIDILLEPYVVAEVVDVQWQEGGNWQRANCDNPHRIVLRVAQDSAAEPPDLPLAPWR